IWTQSFNGTPRYVSANGAREIIGELAIAAPLYAPQLQALAKLAHDASALAQSQLQLTQLQVGTQIVDAWFQLALAQNQQALWQQSLARNQLLYSQVQQAFHAGATARLNLVQTRLLLTQAQNQYAQAQSAVRSARRALNLELALPLSAPTRISRGTKALTNRSLSLPTIWQHALQSQPLLRIAEQQIRQGQTQISVQRAATDPTVTANLAYGVDTATTPQENDLGWQAGINLQLPLFGFGRNQDRIAAAKAHLTALRDAKNALLLQIHRQINTDWGLYRQAVVAHQHSARAAKEARQVYEMTLHGFHAGAFTALTLSQAQTSWIQAALTATNARVQEQLAATQLLLDEGRLPQ
ncbi:MAG: TolC family protein, partial [Acidithiobacillus sp.]|nr:TolC family protein [Acidithiobacillus sp.]